MMPCQSTLAADQQIVSTVYATELMPKTTGDSYRSSRMPGGTKLALLLPVAKLRTGFGFAATLNENR